jgi:Domain of unknown function (DUF4326)
MEITVIGKRSSGDSLVIPIGRTTLMGNPFLLLDEIDRDRICTAHKIWLAGVLINDRDPGEYAIELARKYWLRIANTYRFPNRSAFMLEFDRISKLAQQEPIELQCFCNPLRCHGDNLKAAIEWKSKLKLNNKC